MVKNKYINYIKIYINQNTPIMFEFDEAKYNEITRSLLNIKVSPKEKEIIISVYTLFYSSIYYHKLASDTLDYRPYNILIGDFISSYIAEVLYKNKLIDLLDVFSHNSKDIILNILNNTNEDHLLVNILETIKKTGD